MRTRNWTRRTVVGGALGLAVSNARAESSPQRIVSLNPCLDAILVRVADRRHIAALSHYSRDAQSSSIAAVARTLPFTYESAEEIIELQPDLVLASRHSGVATRRALTSLGIAVATFAVPTTVDESVAQIREVSAHVGRKDRGETLVAQVELALTNATHDGERRPIQALVFQSGGLVAGRDTLIGEVMQRTGFENVAARYGVGSWGTLSLEKLLADPPELLLSGRPRPGAPSWAERLIAHPALAKVASRMRRAEFPPACLYCGGPVLTETARVLAEARGAFWGAS